MRETLKAAFLDWFNNYLTVEKFAEHYEITVKDAQALIDMGRVYHESDLPTPPPWIK